MSLLPRDFYGFNPFHHAMASAFSDVLRDFDRSLRTVEPYWLNQPALQECNIGNSVGKVINNADKFEVDIDVTQFHPEELTVNLREKELVVEGHHEERGDEAGRIERHFVRKYTIPDDINPESIESHLSDRGILSICAKKMTIEGKNARKIPIQAAPRQHPAAEHKETAEKK